MTSKDRNELPSGRCCVKCRCGFEREEDRMCHNSKCECHTPASEKKRCQCDCHEVGAEVLECEKCHKHHSADTPSADTEWEHADSWKGELLLRVRRLSVAKDVDREIILEDDLFSWFRKQLEKARSDGYEQGKDSMEVVFDRPSYDKGRAAALQEVREIVEKMREEKSIDRGWHDEEYSKALSDLLSRLTEI